MLLSSSSRPSLASLLIAQAQARPGAPALRHSDRHMTYRQLLEQVQHVAGILVQKGVEPGDAVALLFQNTIDCVTACLALAWLQARLVPLEPEIGGERLADMQDEIGFGWLAGSTAILQPLAASRARVQHIAIDVEAIGWPAPGTVGVPVPHTPNGVFVYHYTSGSTGLPKAAMHSQENLINGGIIYQQTFHITAADRILAPVPVLHSFGMVGGMVTALVTGAELILTDRFVPQRLLQTIADTRTTILLAVPLMYEMLTFGPPPASAAVTDLRLCLSTGAPLPQAVLERFQRFFGQGIYHVYGCSEAGIISAQTPDDAPDTGSSVGRLVQGVEVRIIDEAQRVVPPGDVGIVEVRTPTMFQGYFNNQAATDSVLHDGWYRSQDLARIQDGYLYLCGRKETFINVGGKKVNPLEIEQVLCAHPHVREAVVWGAATESASESVRASVVLSSPISAAEIIAFCRTRLPAYQVPVSIEVVASLPRAAMGKIVRPRAEGSSH